MRKVRVYLTRVHHTALLHVRQHPLCLHLACMRPGHTRRALARQRLRGTWHKAVVDEKVFLNPQLCVAPL